MSASKLDQMRILVTSCCNLSCTHCYQHYDKNKWSLPFDKIKDLVEYAEKNKVNNLFLSGGEFFMHPKAYSIIEACMEKKIKLTIATNGTCLDMGFFKKSMLQNKIVFQVSIDGMKKNHDLRRGAGSFDKMMNNVKKLYQLGFSITGSMAIDEINFMDMIQVLQIPEFDKINFLPVAYTGAACRVTRSYDELNYQYYEKVVASIYQKHMAGDVVTRVYPHSLGIKYDGNVYLSPVAQDMEVFCIGNIFQYSLKDILQNYLKNDSWGLINDSHRIFQDCMKCLKKNECTIRSLERAYKVNGTIEGSDPFGCRIFRNQFSKLPLGKIFWGEIC